MMLLFLVLEVPLLVLRFLRLCGERCFRRRGLTWCAAWLLPWYRVVVGVVGVENDVMMMVLRFSPQPPLPLQGDFVRAARVAERGSACALSRIHR